MAQAPVFITVPVVAVDRVGSASGTTANLNTALIQAYNTATAGQITAFPTAQSQIIYQEDVQQQSTRTKEILSSSTPAQIAALITSANAGTPGLGSSGKVTLVAGTAAVTIPGLTTNNVGLVSLVSPANGALTVKFSGSATAANTFTITALLAAGTINTADTSVVAYEIVA